MTEVAKGEHNTGFEAPDPSDHGARHELAEQSEANRSQSHEHYQGRHEARARPESYRFYDELASTVLTKANTIAAEEHLPTSQAARVLAERVRQRVNDNDSLAATERPLSGSPTERHLLDVQAQIQSMVMAATEHLAVDTSAQTNHITPLYVSRVEQLEPGALSEFSRILGADQVLDSHMVKGQEFDFTEYATNIPQMNLIVTGEIENGELMTTVGMRRTPPEHLDEQAATGTGDKAAPNPELTAGPLVPNRERFYGEVAAEIQRMVKVGRQEVGDLSGSSESLARLVEHIGMQGSAEHGDHLISDGQFSARAEAAAQQRLHDILLAAAHTIDAPPRDLRNEVPILSIEGSVQRADVAAIGAFEDIMFENPQEKGLSRFQEEVAERWATAETNKPFDNVAPTRFEGYSLRYHYQPAADNARGLAPSRIELALIRDNVPDQSASEPQEYVPSSGPRSGVAHTARPRQPSAPTPPEPGAFRKLIKKLVPSNRRRSR